MRLKATVAAITLTLLAAGVSAQESKPVIPYSFGDWNVITRTIIPVNSVPVGATDSVFGLGDTSLSLFFSPAGAGSLT